MRRISPRTVLIVTSGTAGNRNAERNAAITFCRRKGRIASAEKMGCLEIVRSALMDSTPPVLPAEDSSGSAAVPIKVRERR